MSSSDTYLHKDSKLAGAANWKPWKETLELILLSKDLYQYTLGSSVTPETKDPSHSTWTRDNARAMVIIRMNCTEEPAALITGLRTAKDMWERLQKQYQGHSINLQQQYQTQLSNIKYEQFTNVTSYVVEFRNLMANLSNVDLNWPEQSYKIQFVNGLADAFPVWAERQRSLLRREAKTTTMTYLMEDITNEARTIELAEQHTVLYTKGRPIRTN